MSYIINVLDPNEWDLNFDCTPYNVKPKKNQTLKKWSEDNNADLTWNLCFFNMNTAAARKADAVYNTIQYMRISRLGGDVSYGGTASRIFIPNGDKVAPWKDAIVNGVVKTGNLDKTTRRSRNAFGTLANGKYIVVQTTYGYTETAMCTYVNTYVKTNYKTTISFLGIFDAGGSTGCYSGISKGLFAPEKEGTNGRPVSSVLCAKRKPTATKVTRTLTKGCKGDDVKILQQVLGGIEIDGSFGTGTKNALIAAQKRLGLTADGSCGPLTRKALGIG